jgi:hypothetical protein
MREGVYRWRSASKAPTFPRRFLSPIGRGTTPAWRRQLAPLVGSLAHRRDERPGSHTTLARQRPRGWLTKDRHQGWRGAGAQRGRASGRAACQPARVASRPGSLSPEQGQVRRALPPPGTRRRVLPRLQGRRAARLLAAVPQRRPRLGVRPAGARGACGRRRGTGTAAGLPAAMAAHGHASAAGWRSAGEAAPAGGIP